MGQRYVRKHIVDYQKQQLYNMADISRHEHQLYCYRYVAVGSYGEYKRVIPGNI